MSDSRWIALHCGEESQALIRKHPTAFLLLTQIAMRARWKPCPIQKLAVGQAFIGDWREAGIKSEMAYRLAKIILADCGLATFEGTNKGTIATLSSTMIYSISNNPNNGQRNTPATDKERSSNGQTTTKHTEHPDASDERERKMPRRPTIAEALAAAMEIGVRRDKAEEWWNCREASEWLKGMAGGGTSPVGTNWRADMKTYANRGGLGLNGNQQTKKKQFTSNDVGI